MSEITLKQIREYQKRLNKNTTINEWKAIGREIVEKHNCSTREAIGILRNENDLILSILEKQELLKE